MMRGKEIRGIAFLNSHDGIGALRYIIKERRINADSVDSTQSQMYQCNNTSMLYSLLFIR